jgi:hypothetical protein
MLNRCRFLIVDPFISQNIHQFPRNSVKGRTDPTVMCKRLLCMVDIEHATSNSPDKDGSELEEDHLLIGCFNVRFVICNQLCSLSLLPCSLKAAPKCKLSKANSL